MKVEINKHACTGAYWVYLIAGEVIMDNIRTMSKGEAESQARSWQAQYNTPPVEKYLLNRTAGGTK